MSKPFQFLLILDIDAAIDAAAIENDLPDARSGRRVLNLSAFGVTPAYIADRSALDWPRITSALALMKEQVAAARPDFGPVDFYIAGKAPLSVFFALGVDLDARNEGVVALQSMRDQPGAWVPMDVTSATSGPELLQSVGLDGAPCDGPGRSALFISTQLAEVPKPALRDAIVKAGDMFAGAAGLVTPQNILVAPDNIGALNAQLTRFFVDASGHFPHDTGVTLFFAGPAALALAAGVALNPHQYFGDGRTLDLAEYVAGTYHIVFSLPAEYEPDLTVPMDAASVLKRNGAFTAFKRGVADLQTRLTDPATIYMPAGFGGSLDAKTAIARRFFDRFRALKLPDQPSGEAFSLDVLRDEMRVGHGLLHPLVDQGDITLERLGQLFALHEGVHSDQGIESHNYQGIGRTGFVLEDVDFWADAFGIGNASLSAIAYQGSAGVARSSAILIDYINAHIAAMKAFDIMEQGGDSLRVMPERRFRRYLIWYIQRERARAVHSPEDIKALLDGRLIVEVAPLASRLDRRNDKIIEQALPETTLAVAIGGQARRFSVFPQSFAPGGLIEAVRTFDEPTIDTAANYIVMEAWNLMLPWLPPRS